MLNRWWSEAKPADIRTTYDIRPRRVKGLVRAAQHPILVYKHGEKIPNLVVVTEQEVRGNKLSIALELNEHGEVVELNNVSSVHDKDAVAFADRWRDEAKSEAVRNQWQAAYDYLKAHKAKDIKAEDAHILYTVEIPDDNGSNYLDWGSKPSDEQLRVIRDAYKDIIRDDVDDIRESTKAPTSMSDEPVLDTEADVRLSTSTGKELFNSLVHELGSAQIASKFLSDAGIVGIKYQAGTIHGGAKEGEFNHVIFNDADIKITDKVRFFKTPNGEAYGFTVGGKIYIDPSIATAETPVHEYAHLWGEALRKGNPEEWQNVVGLMKGTSVWEEVKERYPELKTDDEIADEVLATYSGRLGAERLRQEQQRIAQSGMSITDKAAAISALEGVKQALKKFWKAVADFLRIHYTSAEEVADRVMKDLLDGVNPIQSTTENSGEFSRKNPNVRFSLRDGVTYFSGGGLVEAGLAGTINPKAAVELERKAAGVYRNNFGDHIVMADVRNVDPKDLVKDIDGEVGYFHASPVCKNFSKAKTDGEETPLDMATARSTAHFINEVQPRVVTIENVKGYRNSGALKAITDALTENGYKWDAHVYNADDYGAYTNRERLIVRAVRDGELPPVPKPTGKPKGGWLDAVSDIIDTLPEKKNGIAPWMDERLKAAGIDCRNISQPLYVFGQGNPDGKVPHAFGNQLLPTLRTKSGDVIIMPDGRVLKATGRVLARISGLPDSYDVDNISESTAHRIIGNGVPTQLTKGVITPLVEDALAKAEEEHELSAIENEDRGQVKYSLCSRKESERLDKEPTVKVYRSMQVIDGKLYPPMAARIAGRRVDATEFGKWMRADEHPEMAIPALDENGNVKKDKDGNEIYYFKLDKGSKDATGKPAESLPKVRYNPYWHGSRSPLNDQFRSAWIRPNLVTVEMEIPASELTSGYKADKAWKTVGETDWKSGPVSMLLAKQNDPRKVVLSRYCKVLRIVPNDEVAKAIAEKVNKYGIAIPENTVTPQLRVELEKIGVKIGAPEKGVKKTEQIEEALEKGLMVDNSLVEESGNGIRYSKRVQELNRSFNENLQKQINGELEKGYVYEMGEPSVYLRSTGIPNLPIRLQARVLNTKSTDPNHPYDLSEIRDLVKLIQNPIAVFAYGDKTKSQNLMIAVSQNNSQEGKQYLVGISLNPIVNGQELLINSIRNVFPKNFHDWVHWINQNKMLRVDGKEEIQAILNALRINPVDYVSKEDLDSAAKIVKDFKNPPLPEENLTEIGVKYSFAGRKGAASLDKSEEVTTRMDNLAVAREMEEAGKDAKAIKMATGWERGADGMWRYEMEDVVATKYFDYIKEKKAEIDAFNYGIREKVDELRRKRKSLKPKGKAYYDNMDKVWSLEKQLKRYTFKAFKLSDIIDKGHPLLKAYPELGSISVRTKDLKMKALAQLEYNNDNGEMAIKMDTYFAMSAPEELASSLAHEVQHAIQYLEGFARGGNEESAIPAARKKIMSDIEALMRSEEWLEVERLYKENRDNISWDNPTIAKMRGLKQSLRFINPEKAYRQLAGEVEARNVQRRMSMTPEERRASLASETEDIAREDQIFLFGKDGVSAMGSRTNKKMEQVANELDGRDLTKEQQAVADVYSGKADNQPFSVNRDDGKKTIVMRMGNDEHAGAKHSLYRHFNTSVGIITSDDIVRIPEIVERGKREDEDKGRVSYTLVEGHTTYTVVTEPKRGREIFFDFYTNRNAPSSGTSNTQLSAHTNNDNALSGANVQNNSEVTNESAENLSGTVKLSLRSKYARELADWKKRNGLPKSAERPVIPQREPNETARHFANRMSKYQREAALWATAPTDESHLVDNKTTQTMYNRELARGSVMARIAAQDGMLAIRKAQEVIEKSLGVKIAKGGGMDAYTAENRSHGKAKNEFEEFNTLYLKPLRKAYNDMKHLLGGSYDNVKVYMMAKHGLERNGQMAFKYALAKDYDNDGAAISAAYDGYKRDMGRILNDADFESGKKTFAEWQMADDAIREKYAPSYNDFRYDEDGKPKDYSGLSALFPDAENIDEAAADLVKDVERKHKAAAQALWNATNAATKRTLKLSWQAGMMTEANYRYVRDMYQHYIPPERMERHHGR